MDKIMEIIRRKPTLFLVVSIGYILLIGFIKWHIHPPIATIWFLVGGAVGVYFLDAAEVFFALNPSPFRSHLFSTAFAAVSLFILTSSGSLFAQGLVLSIAVTLLLRQTAAWNFFWIYTAVLCVQTILFIAWA